MTRTAASTTPATSTTPAPTSSASTREAGPLRHLVLCTGLGPLLIAADGAALKHVWFKDQAYSPSPGRVGERMQPGEDALLDAAAEQLTSYLAGERGTFSLPLAPDGTPKQRAVWVALLSIPRGETTTYGALAARLGNPRAAQWVGQAVGHNPISIVIPCHRVVGADGSLTGYAGGVQRKRALLELEGYAAGLF